MADNKPESTEEAIKAAVDEADVLPPETENIPSAEPRKKRRIGPWLFLLFIFIGLPAAWLLSPPEIRQLVLEQLTTQKQQPITTAQTPAIEPPATSLPVPDADTASEPETGQGSETQEPSTREPATIDNPVETAVRPITTPPASMAEPDEAASAGENAAPTPAEPPLEDQTAPLLENISRLQSELNDIQSERDSLIQQSKTRNTSELRMLLSLLSNPETRLTQRAALWDNIAALPLLDASEQAKAGKIATLIQNNAAQLYTWRKSLKRLANDIPDAQQVDILPKPENPYFAWLVGAFHLRQAPSKTEQQHNGLRRQLLDMEHALSLEDWPQPRKWRQLLGALRDQFDDDAELGLPESLREIMSDIDASRIEAAGWMETL